MEDRNDITEWLIHFTRDLKNDDFVEVINEIEDVDGQISIEIDHSNQLPYGVTSMTGFEVLKNIIQECGIRYGYSFRKDKTTLYGGDPVVCMTEMPLNSFLKYAKKRKNKSITTYGIAIKKVAAYKLGARPVIYGLSTAKFNYKEVSNTRRIIPFDVMPLQEQYRLVSYNPELKYLDWTHEREWRIKKKHDVFQHTFVDFGYESHEIEVLNIFSEESPCEEIIIIVDNIEDANEIYDQILILRDSGGNNFGNEFLTKTVSILICDRIKEEDLDQVRIENVSKDCYFEIEEELLTKEELLKLNEVIKSCKNEISKKAEREFHELTYLKKSKDGKHYLDGAGFCSIHCYKPRNKYLREMLKMEVASSYGEGYQISAIGNVHRFQSITYHEHIAKEVCDYLNDNLENIFYTKTYMD